MLGKELSDIAVYGREGESPREPGTIGYHSLRAGNIPSSHTVYFGGMGERLKLPITPITGNALQEEPVTVLLILKGKALGSIPSKMCLEFNPLMNGSNTELQKSAIGSSLRTHGDKNKGTFPCIKVCTGMYLLFYSGRISTFSHIKQSDLSARPWTSHPYLS